MRTEKEMFGLIINFAQKSKNIMAVYMNGSRTNSNVPKDIFQDFDIVYVVKETTPFISDKSWISYFGEVAVMQEPDNAGFFENVSDNNQSYAYLMQFTDGNRIDLTFQTIEKANVAYLADKLTILLLDKYEILPKIPAPSDEDYHISKPSSAQYRGCCNEFWWVSTYIAKGLWRKEILFAIDHMNFYVRPMLLKMLHWKIGIETNFSLSAGKNGKYMDKFLGEHEWKHLLETYPKADIESIWEALFKMCELFTDTAKYVGKRLDYMYDATEDEKTRKHLKMVKNDGFNI